MVRYVWDPAKAQANWLKHRIRFELAISVFDDPLLITEPDRSEHGEQRWQTIGTVEGLLLLVVVHTMRDGRDGTEIIRIISARRADPRERRRYGRR